MPRKGKSDAIRRARSEVPKLTHHKASGRAVVRLNGKDHYCGDWGTKAAKAEYDRVTGVWLANGRRFPDDDNSDLRVAELVKRYLAFAPTYYRTDGRTSEIGVLERALKPLVRWFGRERCSDFGPLKLKALREKWIGEGRVRTQINAAVRRVVRCFRWGVENELVDANVLHALQAVPGLRAGRSAAKESDPVQPVPDAVVDAAIPFMPAPVRAMVELQRRCGARPGELIQATAAMVDKSDPAVWVLRPVRHKGRHLGRQRNIFLGPVCQQILTPFMEGRDADAPLFSPRDAVAAMRAERKANRKTPATYGNREGSNRRKKPQRTPGAVYSTLSYGKAIKRACIKAGVEPFAPHRLRHSFATAVRRQFGLEHAQVALGHACASVSEIYAQRDAAKAAAVAVQIG
jgi:integrase